MPDVLRAGVRQLNFRIEPATDALFEERARWQYVEPYDIYNDDGRRPLNPDRFFTVRTDDWEIAGFYSFVERADALVYSLGLRPELTGRGLGLAFVTAGLNFARERFGPSRIVLDVAEFNERAICVYERAGFKRTGTRPRHLEGRGVVTFVDMEFV